MTASSDDDRERRRQYLQEYSDSVDRHRNSASTYESRANEFATNAIKALTYLNGGGLVAIPTVVALFGADPKQAKFELLKAAIFFVIGLFAVVVTQASAYVVFARRMEAESALAEQRIIMLAHKHYPGTADEQLKRLGDAAANDLRSTEKRQRSNYWRRLALVLFCVSLVCFILGCIFGGLAVLT
jgi:hypothetical protein